MLIKLKEIQEKYKIFPKILIHVGAHNAQELNFYEECGVDKIFWVEANSSIVKSLKDNLEPSKNIIIEAVVSDSNNEEVNFNIANNTQASSILDLGTHKSLFPDVSYVETQIKRSKTLDSIFSSFYPIGDIDFLNLDIQGAELKALKGFSDNLNRVKAIYTEINTEEVYKGCGLLSEIDDFLSGFGFDRMETKMWPNHPWGDAFYLKK